MWTHIIAAGITILISTSSSLNILAISLIVKIIAVVLTYFWDKKIYETTMPLYDVNEQKRLELIFQDATLAGTLALIFSSLTLGGITMAGKSLIAMIVVIPFLTLIVSCNYLKYKFLRAACGGPHAV